MEKKITVDYDNHSTSNSLLIIYNFRNKSPALRKILKKTTQYYKMLLPPPNCFLLKQGTVRDNINKSAPCSILLLPQMTGTFGWQNLGQLSCPSCSEMMCWQVISWTITEMCDLLSLPGERLFCSWQQQSLRGELDICGLVAFGLAESVFDSFWLLWYPDFCLVLVTVTDAALLQMVSACILSVLAPYIHNHLPCCAITTFQFRCHFPY